MSSMFTLPSIRLPSFGLGSKGPRVELPSVEIHDVETAAEKRPRTLKHLLRANHANHSIVYKDGRCRNNTAHILGAAYVLGATTDHLNEIYDREAEQLEPWQDAPCEIAKHDWRDFLGKREYQRAFVDFFEDQLVQYSYDWKKMLDDYLFGGEQPLINNFIAGFGHPLIHLGYAFELKSRTLAIEALAFSTCYYNFMHRYLDDAKYTRAPTNPTTSLAEILKRVAADKRFDGVFDSPGAGNVESLFDLKEEAVLEHWNNWQIYGYNSSSSSGSSSPTGTTSPTSPRERITFTEQFLEAQKLVVALLMAKSSGDRKRRYDFYAAQLVTASHAVRVLLPLIPTKFHVPLVRQWWLFVLSTYIAQMRPKVDVVAFENEDLEEGRGWSDVQSCALKGRFCLDGNYVKDGAAFEEIVELTEIETALRAMQDAAKTWPDDKRFFLKAAVRFATEFDGWGGFGAFGDEDVRLHTRTRQPSIVGDLGEDAYRAGGGRRTSIIDQPGTD
ncbi:hypothetical protein SLS58_004986 [Diplodia intermedia]|uniref:Mgs207 protein n=1 Tax=Diplodia intermedia TaxID=856260 RepID=A0ABR3TSL0_9PEZI